ncbi:MAG TPA: hypothetical protein VN026_14790 [Bacteroidia bacterium]|jgi:hypothetical protein|nr:hypothetical protein [Bacteroidia bacterium]
MKKLNFIILLLMPLAQFSQSGVFLELTQEQKYCGGAKPSPEILKQYEKPLIYANKKLIIVSAKGKIDSVKTDSKGVLKLKLKPGLYKLYEPWRYHKATPDGTDIKNFDKECLQKVWAKVDILIDTQKKKQHIEVNIDPLFCMHEIPCVTNPQYPQ